MEEIKAVFSEQLLVPTWEILLLLGIVAITMLVRASKVGILITYMFTLHLALRFVDVHFSDTTLWLSIVLGSIILLLGFVSIFRD